MSLISTAPERQRRRFATVPRFSKDPEVRSVQIGVLATILIHVLLFFVLQMLLKGDHTPFQPRAKKSTSFDIEMAPDALTPPKKPPSKFVETNPDAAENTPDKTENFGAQNQQAAQEKPAPGSKGDRPAIEGRKDIHSTQIVDGRLTQPNLERVPVPPVQTPAAAEATAAAKREQNPLSGFEKRQGDDAQSFGSNVAKIGPNAEAVPEKVEGVKDAPLVQGATAPAIHIDPRKPLPRPELTRNVRPAVFQENKIGTSNIGLSSYDARWSNYGEYLQKMIEAIQQRWDNLIRESKHYPQQGSTVSVTFVLDAAGRIAVIRKVDGTADNLATNWCVTAISPSDGFSYGAWKEDMITVLGTSQEMTFTFLYQ